jgi:hypothetical protein
MSLNFFDHRETITKNLVTFLRQKGYSKLSLSKLSKEHLFNENNTNIYNYWIIFQTGLPLACAYV